MSLRFVRIAAAMVVRNERPYLANCLSHLIENEIDYVIVDNGSTDGTGELLRQANFARHLLGLHQFSYDGQFNWDRLMRAREAAAESLDVDWVLYVSADEVMHSYVQGETLRAAIDRADAADYDAIDFNEFVFLPVDTDYVPDYRGFQPLTYYYFFEPYQPRLMRARKKKLKVSHFAHGGHVLTGEPFRLSPETLALRHYIFRNLSHAFRKYAERVFPPAELARGWHLNRFNIPTSRFAFPSTRRLHRLIAPEDRHLSRANPHKAHYWQWD
jgi:glycosyltransferase involved in cell wall biosynthesis